MNLTIVKIVHVNQNKEMELPYLSTEEEIRSAARQGEDAVVNLVLHLISSWVGVIQQQQN